MILFFGPKIYRMSKKHFAPYNLEKSFTLTLLDNKLDYLFYVSHFFMKARKEKKLVQDENLINLNKGMANCYLLLRQSTMEPLTVIKHLYM